MTMDSPEPKGGWCLSITYLSFPITKLLFLFLPRNNSWAFQITICVRLGHENATIKKQLWDIFYSKNVIQLEDPVEKNCSNSLRKHVINS